MPKQQYRIEVGKEYVYVCGIPKGCAGERYKVIAFVLDVPSYQKKVLVQATTGKDLGLLFVCSQGNFVMRYKLTEEVPDASALKLEVAEATGSQTATAEQVQTL